MAGKFIDEGDSVAGPLEAPYRKLYAFDSPNGKKASIALELLGVPYHVRRIDSSIGENKEPWYLKLNSTGQIPVLSDVDKNGDSITLSESGAILFYLADKYDTEYKISYKPGTKEFYQQLQWFFFSQTGTNAALTEVFVQKFKNPQGQSEETFKRFVTASQNTLKILNQQLIENGTGFIVGDHISIADIDAYAWIAIAEVLDVDISGTGLEAVVEWRKKLSAIPEVAKGSGIFESKQKFTPAKF